MTRFHFSGMCSLESVAIGAAHRACARLLPGINEVACSCCLRCKVHSGHHSQMSPAIRRRLQVGVLAPDAHEDLRTTLLISHPHEDVQCRQGSYLSAASIAALEEMQSHADLVALQALLRRRMLQLVNAADRLRASRASTFSLPRPAASRMTSEAGESSSTRARHCCRCRAPGMQSAGCARREHDQGTCMQVFLWSAGVQTVPCVVCKSDCRSAWCFCAVPSSVWRVCSAGSALCRLHPALVHIAFCGECYGQRGRVPVRIDNISSTPCVQLWTPTCRRACCVPASQRPCHVSPSRVQGSQMRTQKICPSARPGRVRKTRLIARTSQGCKTQPAHCSAGTHLAPGTVRCPCMTRCWSALLKQFCVHAGKSPL